MDGASQAGSTSHSGRDSCSIRKEETAQRHRPVGQQRFHLPGPKQVKGDEFGQFGDREPPSNVGISASTLVTRRGPTGVTVALSPFLCVKRQASPRVR